MFYFYGLMYANTSCSPTNEFNELVDVCGLYDIQHNGYDVVIGYAILYGF
jgi:hypothetical protein